MPEPTLHVPGIPGSEPPPHRSPRLWAELAIALVLIVAVALLTLGFVLQAVGAAPRTRGASRSGAVAGALIGTFLVALLTRWAIYIEHRMRRGQPAAQAWESGFASVSPAPPAPLAGSPATSATAAAAPAQAAAGAAASRRSALRQAAAARRRRAYSPAGTRAAFVVLGLTTVGLLGGAYSTYQQGQRSGYVQAHGIRAAGSVTYVDNTEHCGRGGCHYTAAVGIALAAPVDGTATTTVHYPGRSYLTDSEQVAVLVDPREPGYAELPGYRFEESWTWIILLVMALFFGFLTYADGRQLVKLRRHRQAMQMVGSAD